MRGQETHAWRTFLVFVSHDTEADSIAYELLTDERGAVLLLTCRR